MLSDVGAAMRAFMQAMSEAQVMVDTGQRGDAFRELVQHAGDLLDIFEQEMNAELAQGVPAELRDTLRLMQSRIAVVQGLLASDSH